MIPRIIHQTWKADHVPDRFTAYAETWGRFNPDWQRILWTDRVLLGFVEQYYPELLEIFCSYPAAICRADAARYMLLHRFGGVYADIDAECIAPLSSLERETRAVLCHEPPTHWPLHAPYRGHPFVLFNGVMASPAGHPFWREVLDRLPATRYATDILDVAGPCLLTGVYLGFEKKESVAVHGCRLFTPTDSSGSEIAPYDQENTASLTRHYWAGTWWTPEKRRKPIRRALVASFRRLRHRLTQGAVLDMGEARAAVDAGVLTRAPPIGNRYALLVPLRDAAPHLDSFIEAIVKLDLPAAETKLVFCEGDSVDDTWARLSELAPGLRQRYREVVLLRKDVGTAFSRAERWDSRIQRARRGGLARVRNHLIMHGLDETDDWALWIDVDVWRFPADIMLRLRQANARIVAPNCVVVPGGTTYDMNSFVTIWEYPDIVYYRHTRNGLFQPPARARGRLYLDCLRHSDRVELDGVGGTMLLVDASLHRGGLHFPEIPYRDHIETEGFGLLARDLGVRAVGLPRVEVLHVPE
jgi:hypothetical protein